MDKSYLLTDLRPALLFQRKYFPLTVPHSDARFSAIILFNRREAFAATAKTKLYIFGTLPFLDLFSGGISHLTLCTDESIPPSPILNHSRESSSLLLFDSTLWGK